DHVGVHVRAVVEGEPPAATPTLHLLYPAAEAHLHAEPAVLLGDQVPDRLAHGAVHHVWLRVDENRLAGQLAYCAGGLTSGEPGADDGNPLGVPQVLTELPGVVDAVQDVDAGAGRPALGQGGIAAGRDDEPVERVLLVGLGQHRAAAHIDLDGPPAVTPGHLQLAVDRHPDVLRPCMAGPLARR